MDIKKQDSVIEQLAASIAQGFRDLAARIEELQTELGQTNAELKDHKDVIRTMQQKHSELEAKMQMDPGGSFAELRDVLSQLKKVKTVAATEAPVASKKIIRRLAEKKKK